MLDRAGAQRLVPHRHQEERHRSSSRRASTRSTSSSSSPTSRAASGARAATSSSAPIRAMIETAEALELLIAPGTKARVTMTFDEYWLDVTTEYRGQAAGHRRRGAEPRRAAGRRQPAHPPRRRHDPPAGDPAHHQLRRRPPAHPPRLRALSAAWDDLLSLKVANDLAAIPQRGGRARGLLRSATRIPSRTVHRFNLALEEVLTNVIAYAFPAGGRHEIDVRIAWRDGTPACDGERRWQCRSIR